MAVALGGCAGALARYSVAQALPTPTDGWPWATFTVNVSGSALLGALLVTVVERLPRGHLARPLLGTGLIGAYTTFSTLTVEAILLVRHGAAGRAALYVLVTLAAGLAGALVGVVAARSAFRDRPPEAAEEASG